MFKAFVEDPETGGNLTFDPIALTPPPDWDGPKVIILDVPATVVTVGFGSVLGIGALYILSNI